MKPNIKKYNQESQREIMAKLSALEVKSKDTDAVRKLRDLQSSLSVQLPSDAIEIVDIDKKIAELIKRLAPHISKGDVMATEFVIGELEKLIGERNAY